ncbi:MAG: ATP phosphoribosyltransferase regulatory subunit [Clostridia bacterium]|nr:ATP phosphoribosyltransferase regulatory subunit [Clostridia bacterium]
MDYESLMTDRERVSFALRRLYRECGFAPYRMSKFEEYDLYASNKEFLVSPQVITFTDTDGVLMALKPDVTLSIAKNYDSRDALKKLYYNETVYRPAQSGGFSEILQSGVECMGDLGEAETEEILSLAAACLKEVSEDFVLSVSDLGVVEALFSEMSLVEGAEEELAVCIHTKNAVEARRLCEKNGVGESLTELLVTVINTSLPLGKAADVLLPLAVGEEMRNVLKNLQALAQSPALAAFGDRVIFDSSVLPNRRFYNGLVFSGYVAGASRALLSGGRYDKLMRRLGKQAAAVGFAVYLDRLPEEVTA